MDQSLYTLAKWMILQRRMAREVGSRSFRILGRRYAHQEKLLQQNDQ